MAGTESSSAERRGIMADDVSSLIERSISSAFLHRRLWRILGWVMAMAVISCALFQVSVQHGYGGCSVGYLSCMYRHAVITSKGPPPPSSTKSAHRFGHRLLASSKAISNLSLFHPHPFAMENATSISPVLVHQIPTKNTKPKPLHEEAGLNADSCSSYITNMMFDSNGTTLYYVLEERCWETGNLDDEIASNERISFRKANFNLTGKKEMKIPIIVEGDSNHSLISYWWTMDKWKNGSPELSASGEVNPDRIEIDGVELSKDAQHLVVLSSDSGEGFSFLTALSTTTGVRTAIKLSGKSAASLQGLAWRPNTTELCMLRYLDKFTSLVCTGFEPSIGGSGLPNATFLETSVVGELLNGSDGAGGDSNIGPLSFGHNGSFLFFINPLNTQVLSFHTIWTDSQSSSSSSSSSPPSSSAYSEEEIISPPYDPVCSDANVSLIAEKYLSNYSLDGQFRFTSLTDLVVTPDGCNIFVTEGNFLDWIQVDSPCDKAVSTHIVASYGGSPLLSGLTLRRFAGNLSLWVGGSNGDLFELPIDESKLHSCSYPPPPPAPSSLMAPFVSASSPWAFSSEEAAAMESSTPSPSSSEEAIASLPFSDATASDTALASDRARQAGELAMSPRAVTTSSSSTRDQVKGSKDKSVALKVGLSLGSVILFALVAFVIVVVRRAWPPRQTHDGGHYFAAAASSSVSGPGGGKSGPGLSPPPVIHYCRQYNLASLAECTDNFAESHRIVVNGHVSGAIAEVYRGTIAGEELAMKVWTGNLGDVKRKRFVDEVDALCRLHHANIARLVGYCQEGNQLILVYPYYKGGSLYSRLHTRPISMVIQSDGSGTENHLPPPLSLIERMCIGFQIAKAVHYLHDGVQPPFVHRDIKSSNVLLTGEVGTREGEGGGGEIRAVLADCGWASICENVFGITHEDISKTATSTGTFGSIAPEYLFAAQSSETNDVYSVGVVLLEMLTGKKAVTMAPTGIGCLPLADWVHLALRDRDPDDDQDHGELLDLLLEPTMREQSEGSEAEQMVMRLILLASRCTDDDEQARPPIASVSETIRLILEGANRRCRFSIR